MTVSEIHIGKLVEERIQERGMSKANFGRRMNTSRQNVNTLLRKRVWDVQQLLDASRILEMNFFEPFLKLLGEHSGGPGRMEQGKDKKMRVLVEVDDPGELQAFWEWQKERSWESA